MKALVKYDIGVGYVGIRDVAEPVLTKDNWAIIKIMASGVCGTDIHVWQDQFMYWPPVILGHEFSGVVTETGKDCKKVKVGDRVVAEPNTGGCGLCVFCRSGRMHMCPEKLTLGWRIDGTFTDYIALPEMVLHKIPDELSFELAALCEPMAITVYDIAENGKIGVNDIVVIQGSGPIGIMAAYVAKALGAAEVILSGLDASEYCRFDVARKVGADFIVNVQKENILDKVMEITRGKGADCVIETSGSPIAIGQCVDMLKRNGRLIGVGIPSQERIMFPWKEAVLKNLEFYFKMSSSYTSWDKALAMLSRGMDKLQSLITRKATIDEWESVFDSLVKEKGVKSVFCFND
jgi:L-iditol 2-dehydrogenase